MTATSVLKRLCDLVLNLKLDIIRILKEDLYIKYLTEDLRDRSRKS